MKEKMNNSLDLPYESIEIDPSLRLRQLHPDDAEDVFSTVDANREEKRQTYIKIIKSLMNKCEIVPGNFMDKKETQ